MKILFFAITATGEPKWREPSNSPEQPHIVRYASIITDENKKIHKVVDLVVKADGWELSEDAIKRSGLSESILGHYGVSEESFLSSFYDDYQECDFRVCYGTTFNNRMVRIAEQRYMPDGLFGDGFKDKSKYLCINSASKKKYGKELSHDIGSIFERETGHKYHETTDIMEQLKAVVDVYFSINPPKIKEKNQ